MPVKEAAEWAAIVSAGGILLLWWQLRLTKKMVRADHERSRRHLALDISREWNRSVGPETSAAQKLISALNPNQCRRIANHKSPVRIAKKHKSLVETCCPSTRDLKTRKGKLFLDDAAVKQIRYLGVHYLNELEIALSAWHKAVGDKKYIESEFEFVIEELTMPSFRDALQAGTFPAIEAFLSRNAKRPDQELGDVPGWVIVIVKKLFGRTSDS